MISIIKKFNRLLERSQKKKVIILSFMMLVGACLESLGVSLMLPLVSVIMQPDIMKTNRWIAIICRIFGIHSYRDFVVLCIIALIIIFVIKNLFLILQYYAQARFVFNNRLATQCRLLHTFMMRPYEYYLNVNSGEIIRVLQRDVKQTYDLLTTMLKLAMELVISGVLIITVFIVEPAMTIFIAVALMITLLAITKIVKPLLQREGLSIVKHTTLSNQWLLQAINGIKETKVTHKEEFFEANYNISGRYTTKSEKWNYVFANIPRQLIEMISVCSVLILIAIMILMGKEIELLIPSLGAFAMAAVKLLPSANRIVVGFNDMAYQEPALNSLLENLDLLENREPNQTILQTEPKKDFKIESQIELRGISYSYPDSHKAVLEDTGCIIPVGKSVGIVGTSGAGKTTAVDIMLGLLIPQKGQVLVDNIDIQENYVGWLSHIGYIPQMIFMLDDTIRANVAFGIPEKEIEDEKVWKALEEAQLAAFVRDLPRGLDTTIGERGIRLSGGQRQRIGIARALYPDPEVLIFDEATSALDNDTESSIMESINSLHGRKTMVIIAHRLQTIEGCDLVFRVEDGKIRKVGG